MDDFKKMITYRTDTDDSTQLWLWLSICLATSWTNRYGL